VRLFALFHDSRRINEYRDDDHGLRGGEFAHSLRGSLVHLDDARFELLFEACRLHTDGHTDGDETLQACWDAVWESSRDPIGCARTQHGSCSTGRTSGPSPAISHSRFSPTGE
jgi:hypothetical protein